MTFTATVRPKAAAAISPSGTVDFFDTTTNTDLGTTPVSDGVAQLTTSALAAGNDAIVASYSGDESYRPSIDFWAQAVGRATANLSLVSTSVAYDGTSHPATATLKRVKGEDLGPLSFSYNGTSDVPTQPGSYAVTASFAGDNNYEPVSANATLIITGASLQPDPEDASKAALYIVGTAGRDTILVKPADRRGNLTVTVNNSVQGTFKPTGHILVYGLEGNDQIRLLSRAFRTTVVTVAVPAMLDGGAGDDLLSAAGSKANNIVLGGDGNDSLIGGGGRDLLIGGDGRDTVRGGGAADIAIGDRTTFDANLDTLFGLMAEWSRTDATYGGRIDHLNGTVGGGLNGAFVLNADAIPVDDSAVDLLYGQGGKDWFLDRGNLGAKDLAKDRLLGELLTVF